MAHRACIQAVIPESLFIIRRPKRPQGPCYDGWMGRADRITVLLAVAALCGTIIGTSCSTNARIGDMNARIGDMNARFDDVNARIGDVNTRVDALTANVNARFDDVNARIDDLRRELLADIRELRAIVIDAIKTATPAAD